MTELDPSSEHLATVGRITHLRFGDVLGVV
jgi:hypothetical protein